MLCSSQVYDLLNRLNTAQVKVEMEYRPVANYLTLEFIEVERDSRGQGLGHMTMKEIVRFADLHCVDIYLDIMYGPKSEMESLRNFYKNYDFVDLKMEHKYDMVRKTRGVPKNE
jgi:GNAT superfamily N-acetyltransferase